MEIILKQDVQNLGYADALVKVKDGYARNFLKDWQNWQRPQRRKCWLKR